ncbi:MAG: VanZ family protein [Reichenbachiella sp.]
MKSKITAYFPPFAFFTFIIWMIFQADMDQNNIIMEIGHSVPYGDKIGHFMLFGLLALLLNMALKFKQINISSRKFHLGSVVVFAFAIGEEFTQLAFETRTFDLIDMLFDLFGIGILSSISFRKYVVNRIKSFAEYLSIKLLIE